MSTTVLDSIKKVRDFMLEDLNKTADLDKKHPEWTKFSPSIGFVCCYTEYWGKLVTENKLKATDSFNTHSLQELGSCYDSLIKSERRVRFTGMSDAVLPMRI